MTANCQLILVLVITPMSVTSTTMRQTSAKNLIMVVAMVTRITISHISVAFGIVRVSQVNVGVLHA